jgi:opacity protein-like surface antigen
MLAGAQVLAADNGFYFGGGLAYSEFGLDNPLDAQPFDDNDNGFKLIAGWRALDSFGVEASYADHGKAVLPTGVVCIQLVGVPCPATVNIDAKTLSAFAVGYLDFPLIDLFAKAGLTSWKVKGSAPGLPGGFSVSEDDTDFAWGAGVQAHLRSLAARLEYENFKLSNDEKLGMVSLSVMWTLF